jgi:hypothetical protein
VNLGRTLVRKLLYALPDILKFSYAPISEEAIVLAEPAVVLLLPFVERFQSAVL